MKYTIAIAGSTAHTLMCAEALAKEFQITWVLTPSPRRIGRQQVLTKNPMHLFAEESHIPIIPVETKIDEAVQHKIESFPQPDFLLVVDFGYLIPDWLLAWPTLVPLNIHPSLLPRWRGSSPGQFVLLYGEKTSAVTLMKMNSGLDTGDILVQKKFDVQSAWTQSQYYQQSFQLCTQTLAGDVTAVAQGKIQPQPQPAESPTPLARRLQKDDGFVSWEVISRGIGDASTLLREVYAQEKNWPNVLANATRALQPWPTLWTLIPTQNGQKRMQILRSHVEQNELLLDEVKIEGQKVARWADVQNVISSQP